MQFAFPFLTFMTVSLIGSALGGQLDDQRIKPQDRFFRVMESGDENRLLTLFHPGLRSQFDAPVVKAWMDQLNQKLGPYRGMTWTDFKSSSKWVNGVKLEEAEGTFLFEQGKAKAAFVYQDQQLVKFDVEVLEQGTNWAQRPASYDLYVQRGQEFLSELVRGDSSNAFARLHPNLQAKLSVEELERIHNLVSERLGPLRTVSVERVQPEDSRPFGLRIYYRMQYEKGERVAHVGFQFAQLKGHMLSFNIATTDELPYDGTPLDPAFLEALGQNDVDGMIRCCHPGVLLDMDPPMLRQWVKAMQAAIGTFRRIPAEDFQLKVVYEDGIKSIRGNGRVEFEKADAQVSVTYQQGRVTAFKVKSEALASGWFQGPSDQQYYARIGKQFLELWLAGQDQDAYPMLHESVRDVLSLERFHANGMELREKFGKVVQIEFEQARFDNRQGDRLELLYNIGFASTESIKAQITIQFQGLRGHLTQYQLIDGAEVNKE